jgi:hypothetical protein
MFFSPENFSQMAGNWISKLAKRKEQIKIARPNQHPTMQP